MPGSHGSGCSCQHELAAAVAGTEWLNEHVDIFNVVSVNEEFPGASKSLFRPYSDRLADPDPSCNYSGQDEEKNFYDEPGAEGLTITVPFACPVKITGITVIPGDRGRKPGKLDLYPNLIDIGTVGEVPASQTIDNLVEDLCGVVEYSLRVVKFSSVTTLTLHFSPSEGPFDLCWIGLRGIASGDQRRAVVTVYESRANLADHDLKEQFGVSRQIN